MKGMRLFLGFQLNVAGRYLFCTTKQAIIFRKRGIDDLYKTLQAVFLILREYRVPLRDRASEYFRFTET